MTANTEQERAEVIYTDQGLNVVKDDVLMAFIPWAEVARRAPAVAVPTIAQVEDAVGMGAAAWDCIAPQAIIDAVLGLSGRCAPAATVPQGWKPVPAEPTENMYMCVGYYKDDPAIAKRVIRRDYKAMLAAAPQPPEADHIPDAGKMVPAPVQLPENLREGEPYDNPAFEALARALGVWGTAQSAACAQFWIAAKEQST